MENGAEENWGIMEGMAGDEIHRVVHEPQRIQKSTWIMTS